jgi:hypothetical protein
VEPPPTLNYKTAAHGSPTLFVASRRTAARHLKIWSILLLLFAAAMAYLLFDGLVVKRTWHHVPVRALNGRMVWDPVLVITYQWNRLFWVFVLDAAPIVLAGAYWFLARAIPRNKSRAHTIVALVLAILHTLAASMLLLIFFCLWTSHLQLTRWNFSFVASFIVCAIGVAMVPGMLYLCMRLMDILNERQIPRRTIATVATPEPSLIPAEEDEDESESDEEDKEPPASQPSPSASPPPPL